MCLAWLGLVAYTVRTARSARTSPVTGNGEIAVIYASQTGTAKDLAQRTVDALGAERATLVSMAQLNPDHLLHYKIALFIVSTYGEGDPPDMAQSFYTQALALPPNPARISHLQVAMLALGDSSYSYYCGFGRTLSEWLEQHGAVFLFDPVLADQCDHNALLTWRNQLSKLFQARMDTESHYSAWRLVQRRLLNPNSLGGPCYEVRLEPVQAEATSAPANSATSAAPAWQAGDIAEIEIGPHRLHRDYSIASIASEGALSLLIRQQTTVDGKPGLGSHWLTQDLEPGAIVQLRIRENPLFHAPNEPRPAIFIGNGTGIAGLRSLLAARIEQGHDENWLIFGERQRACDFHYGEELSEFHAQGKISRLDLAFSRDQARKHYVHDLLREAAPAVKDWVARGAMLYVCGSKNGMAHDVDHALRDILGAFGYEALLQGQRYRRDVY